MRISDWSSDVCSSDLLDDTGLPVPRVFWIDRDGRWLGRPAVVLARCPGRDDRSLLLPQGKAGLHESQRVAIAAEMVNLLAAIHSLDVRRSEEHTSELQSLMRISYAVFCLNKKRSTTENVTANDDPL